MQVQFLKPVTIGLSTYGVGVHDVPTKDTKNNWFFDALVEDGSAIILRADDIETPEAEPQKRKK